MCRQVKDVVEYLQEVSKIKAEWPNSTLVFRGQENEKWPLASSAERRLKASLPSQNRIPDRLFIEYHEDLLKKCKLKNYDQREQKQLDDLELLADLQHHGAATCLIDFTRNALIALWFACEKSDADGKVFVVNIAGEKIFWEITDKDKDKPIRNILEFKTRPALPNQPSFWYWTPAHLNERITAQHSLFLFGLPSSEGLRQEEIIIESARKEQMRKELEELHDICEESLFPDFVGFSYTQRSDAPYLTPDTEKYLRRGIEAGQRGQYSEAIASFTKAIELKLDHAEAYYFRGLVYSRQRKQDHTIQDLTKAIELKLDHADVYYFRGLAYSNQEKYDHAIQDLTKAIELKPDHDEAYYLRGFAYSSQEKYDHAIQDLTKAIELKPDHDEAYYLRGFAYSSQEKYDHAIQDYTKAIELKLDHADVYYFRGLTWLNLKKWKEANSDLTAARDMGLDIVSSFRRDYNSVADSEQRIGTKLPEDIAAMLTESEN